MSSQKTSQPESPVLRSFYEKEATEVHRYDSEKFWESRYHQKKASIVRNILESELKKDNLILDAGCGTGELSVMAKEMGGEVVSIDFSKTYLKRVSRNVGNRVCASLTHLPFKEKSFDIVICTDVIEHVPQYDRVVEQLRSVSLKKIVLTAPCQGLLREVYGKLFPQKLKVLDEKVGHINILPIEKFQERLLNDDCTVSSRSFFVVQSIAEGLIPKRLDPIISLGEHIADLILPGQGTISLAVVSFRQP
jgi:ubiquinone/menaquinone biosynthesis C-methylase UbiE